MNTEKLVKKVNKHDDDIVKVHEQLDKIENDIFDKTNNYYDYLDEGVITFIDDDCSRNFLTNLKPAFESHNMKCCLGLITDNIGSSSSSWNLTLNELKQLQLEGYEILCHSKTHDTNIFNNNNISNVSEDTIYNDLKQAQDFMIKHGLSGYKTLVYPYGGYSSSNALKIKSIARKLFDNAINASGWFINECPTDNLMMNRFIFTCTKDADVEWLKTYIDKCKNEKKWLILGTHAFQNIEVTYINKLLDYIQQQNIKVMTFSEANRKKGNLVSCGEFTSNNKIFIGVNGNTTLDIPSKVTFVGGVNLFQESKTFNSKFWKETNEHVSTAFDGGLFNSKYINISNNWQGKKQSVYLEKGKTYIISLYAKSSVSNASLSLYTTKFIGNFSPNVSNSNYTRYSITFTHDGESGNVSCIIQSSNIGTLVGTISLCCPQIEEGSTLTSFKQSLNDIERLITI